MFTKRTLLSAGLACMLCLGLIPGFTAQASAELPVTVPPPPALEWRPCPGAPARDCATLRVPLDYANLNKGTIDVSVARAPASDPANRLGTLVYNPGGPGQAVADFVQSGDLSSRFSQELQARFDIVGFNPRGAQGIRCLPDSQAQKKHWEPNHLPRTTAEINVILGLENQANQNCLNLNQPLVRHIDTASVVRDMEQLRRAMGIGEFNYWGDSYGTFLGNRYAKLYPGHLRSMVLDAATDRSISDMDQLTASALALDQGWDRFKSWCQANPGCALRGQNIDAVFDAVLARARTKPIPAPASPLTKRAVNDWILAAVVQALITPGSVTYEWVETVIDKGRKGDASLARALYDRATGAISDNTYLPNAAQHRAITCVDTSWSQQLTSAPRVRAIAQLFGAAAPRFGEAAVWQSPAECYRYPIAPVEAPPVDSTVADDFPVLVIGGTQDIQTPFGWSQHSAEQIEGARLLTRQGGGHTSYNKSRCVQAAVAKYLTSLTLPPEGAVCQTDPDLYPPQPVPVLPLSSGTFELPEAVLQSVRAQF